MTLNAVDEALLATVADLHGQPQGAFNIRKDGQPLARRSTDDIEVRPKADKPGIDIIVKPGVKGKSVHIPVILTIPGLSDLVYNTIEVGEDADVTVVAGCGIHNSGSSDSRHDGIHEVLVRRGARLAYVEKHYGEGPGRGARVLNPQTVLHLEEGAYARLELVQIRGVDSSVRVTRAVVGGNATLVISERLLTHGKQTAESSITAELTGEGARAEVLSRSVGQDGSSQVFRASLVAAARCWGHVACDSIIMDEAHISSMPQLDAMHPLAEVTHEAAIGRIAGDQLTKLMTLGLTEREATQAILSGFLS